MKFSFLTLLFILCCIARVEAQSSYSEGDSILSVQAMNLAQTLKDSLHLSPKEMNDLYEINIQIAKQKKAVFKLQDRALVGRQLQLLENSRDSLYNSVLDKKAFEKYLKSKKNILAKGPKGP